MADNIVTSDMSPDEATPCAASATSRAAAMRIGRNSHHE